MDEDYRFPDDEERLDEENQFLKMKLMLEHGASFSPVGNEEIPPELENLFLNQVLEFEKQFNERKMIRVFDKIGRPTHFLPAADIAEENIEKAWDELADFLEERGVALSACSPRVTARELYRFATEELFQLEAQDISVPGYMTHFIYDEFYPDPVYDSTHAAVDGCMWWILDGKQMEIAIHFAETGLTLNDHRSLSRSEFAEKVNRFKSVYDDLDIVTNEATDCQASDRDAKVSGRFILLAKSGLQVFEIKGTWEVDLERDTDTDWWYAVGVRVDGINF